MDKEKKIIIGFIIYGQNTFKYLPYFLSSLKNQTTPTPSLKKEGKIKIIAFNNGAVGDENVKYLQTNYPEIEIMGGGENLGFAAAYNQMIAKAFALDADYFLMTNPDIIFEPDVLEKLAQKLEAEKELGSVCPKILRWDFSAEAARAKAKRPTASGGSLNPAHFESNSMASDELSLKKVRDEEKTDTIDSCGISLKSGLRFFDVGQGRKDEQNFLHIKIIGPSGACGLFRMAALEQIKENGKYLDERMFMYKEDCDLDYRLYLKGQTSVCASEAVVYHDRTAAGTGESDLAVIKARKNKSRDVRRMSLLNQQLIFKKYWHLQNVFSKINIIFYLAKSFFYSLFFEQFLLKDFLTIFISFDKIDAGKD
jgi:N-acetylglucosaminyl-diphospho-decaprenol L-rhamnosyltransferase